MCGITGECWWEKFRSRVDARIFASAAMARCGVLANTSYGGSSWAMKLEGRCWAFESGRKEVEQGWGSVVICRHIAGRVGFWILAGLWEPGSQLGGETSVSNERRNAPNQIIEKVLLMTMDFWALESESFSLFLFFHRGSFFAQRTPYSQERDQNKNIIFSFRSSPILRYWSILVSSLLL